MLSREQIKDLLQKLPLAEEYEARRQKFLTCIDTFGDGELAQAEQIIIAFVDDMEKNMNYAGIATNKAEKQFRTSVEKTMVQAEGSPDAALNKLSFTS